jgi:HicB family
MNLSIVIEGLREELQGLGELGDERSNQVARRLGDALASSLRLKVFDLLGQAALELSSKLPSGHIEVRLAGQEPELVFVDDAATTESATAGEELSARITLRLPDSLKSAVERAADREGISTNAWLVRAIARATESRPAQVTGKRLTGYAQG